MLDVFARIEKAAAGDANVCIYGESGTGKELIARAIHEISDRRHGPLITFDCTAVPEGLAESQLFGHVRGAFTGAIEHRDGVFCQANKGTLFIDELCELSPALQAKRAFLGSDGSATGAAYGGENELDDALSQLSSGMTRGSYRLHED